MNEPVVHSQQAETSRTVTVTQPLCYLESLATKCLQLSLVMNMSPDI